MKTKIRITGSFLLMIILIIVSAACNDDDSSGAKLSFSRSIYILPSNGSLEVELRASVAPETDLSIPVIIEGTAILDEAYMRPEWKEEKRQQRLVEKRRKREKAQE